MVRAAIFKVKGFHDIFKYIIWKETNKQYLCEEKLYF